MFVPFSLLGQIQSQDLGFEQPNGVPIGIYWKNSSYQKESAAIRAVDFGSYARQGIGFFTGDFHDRETNALERMRITRDGKLGLGTTVPHCRFHLRAGQQATYYDPYASMVIEEYDARLQIVSSDGGSNGSCLSLSNVHSSWTLHQKTSAVNNRFDIGYCNTEAAVDLGAVQNVVMSMMTNGNVGIGITSPDFKLDVAGTIRAEEITVQAKTADFVFEDDYQLKTLNEVEQFITSNNHLPDIPSARQMEENGIGLAEMNKLLLQKIEELMLYTIEQDKELTQQKQLNESQAEKLERLEKLEERMRLLESQMKK